MRIFWSLVVLGFLALVEQYGWLRAVTISFSLLGRMTIASAIGMVALIVLGLIIAFIAYVVCATKMVSTSTDGTYNIMCSHPSDWLVAKPRNGLVKKMVFSTWWFLSGAVSIAILAIIFVVLGLGAWFHAATTTQAGTNTNISVANKAL